MFKKIKASEIPKRKRTSVTRFEKTKEWTEMRASLHEGLRANQALQVILTPEDKKKYRIKSLRSCARFVQKYLREAKLPYKASAFHIEAGDVIIVEHAHR
jgi:hypothetical protein